MAFVNTTNLALPGSAVKGDGAGTWVAQWNQMCANLESRLTKSGSGTPVSLVAGDYVGQKYYRTDAPGEIWQCTLAGSIGTATWTNILNSVSVTAGALSVTGASTLGGAVALNENATLLSTKKIIVPTGENWLRKSGGTEDMNPHAHAVRHTPGLVNGVWDAASDFVKNAIQRIVHSETIVNTALGTLAFASQNFTTEANCSISISTIGRPGPSHGLLYGEILCPSGLSPGQGEILYDAAIFRDSMANQVGSLVRTWLRSTNTNFPVAGTVSFLRRVTNLSVATHVFTLHTLYVQGTAQPILAAQLTYIDLGTE